MAFSHPDFDALQQAVCDAARGVFLNARAKRSNETFFAYVLTTYGSGSLGGCCINTLENHARVMREAQARDFAPEQELYYKWCCADWGEGEYVDNHRDALMAAYEQYDRAMETFRGLLAEHGRDESDIYGWSEDHPLHLALANALEQLDREGVFGAGAARQNALVFMMQYDGDDELVPWSIARLNPSASHALKQEASGWLESPD